MISGEQTDGAYSMMEWTVASRALTHGTGTDEGGPIDFGPHRHTAIDEVFVVQRGTIEFLLGDVITTLTVGDTVRVPAGERHGYVNMSGADVELLVWFSPGGFEQLFLEYRTDHATSTGPGFIADAERHFGTTFEVAAS